jgi:hypothetical protein
VPNPQTWRILAFLLAAPMGCSESGPSRSQSLPPAATDASFDVTPNTSDAQQAVEAGCIATVADAMKDSGAASDAQRVPADAGVWCPFVPLCDACNPFLGCPPPFELTATPSSRCGSYDALIWFEPGMGYGGDYVLLYDATGTLVGAETNSIGFGVDGHGCESYDPSFTPVPICDCDPLPERCSNIVDAATD